MRTWRPRGRAVKKTRLEYLRAVSRNYLPRLPGRRRLNAGVADLRQRRFMSRLMTGAAREC
jgi:hypothetical protein